MNDRYAANMYAGISWDTTCRCTLCDCMHDVVECHQGLCRNMYARHKPGHCMPVHIV